MQARRHAQAGAGWRKPGTVRKVREQPAPYKLNESARIRAHLKVHAALQRTARNRPGKAENETQTLGHAMRNWSYRSGERAVKPTVRTREWSARRDAASLAAGTAAIARAKTGERLTPKQAWDAASVLLGMFKPKPVSAKAARRHAALKVAAASTGANLLQRVQNDMASLAQYHRAMDAAEQKHRSALRARILGIVGESEQE